MAESDHQLGPVLAEGLERHGLGVVLVTSGAQALVAARDERFAAIVLGSVDQDPLAILRHLRDAGIATPIIVLVEGEDGVNGRVASLSSGADDSLSWPISCLELAARITALQRCQRCRTRPVVRCADLVLDRDAHRVWRGTVAIDLSKTELSLLHLFMTNPDLVLSRRFLMGEIWGSPRSRSNLLPVYIRYLREKIDRPFGRANLQTVRGVGYRFIVDDAHRSPRLRVGRDHGGAETQAVDAERP